MGGASSTHWRIAYTSLVGKYEGKRLLGRPRRRWEDESRMTREVRYTFEVIPASL
jgi:hypothetical protein